MERKAIVQAASLSGGNGEDCVIIVASSLKQVQTQFGILHGPINAQVSIDKSASTSGCVVSVPGVAGGRAVFAPTGQLDRDYDDSRRWTEAAASGIKRAIECGSKKPLLAVASSDDWADAPLLALLGALDALYVPIEIREDVPSKRTKVDLLSTLSISEEVVQKAYILDQAKSVGKDIGGSDPERMAPPRVEEYLRGVFKNSKNVKIEVISNDATLVKEYPLFSAVNRCAKNVPRHQGRIILLSYTPADGPVDKSLFLVGKGVTYDTGGADIKAGGVMAGMHRDKCGAAAVAGYFRFLDLAAPAKIKVTAAMCMVRNSVGSECYVADEIITSRAGVRVRVGNTDAEGRMAMADSLSRMKDLAIGQPDPHIMTVATLTGHVCLAYGDGYTAIMDNGPARDAGVAQALQQAGDSLAEPVEISTIRREDYEFHRGKSEYEDVLQCNNAPSSRTPRGHQSPAAFLILASGMDKHGRDSNKPLKYSHVDMAAAAGPFPGLPTGAPVLAFAKMFSPQFF